MVNSTVEGLMSTTCVGDHYSQCTLRIVITKHEVASCLEKYHIGTSEETWGKVLGRSGRPVLAISP